MAFSFSNSDVDRLSLDQRVSKLEKRGGSGGGGNFSGNLPDFDQFPDNAVKLTNEGLVFKFSIDDVGTTFNSPYSGLEIKVCALTPFYSGILSAPFYLLCRVRYKKNVNDFAEIKTYQGKVSIDMSDYAQLQYQPRVATPSNAFALMLGALSSTNAIHSEFLTVTFNINLGVLGNANNVSFSVNKRSPINLIAGPSYHFGASLMYQSSYSPRFGGAGMPYALVPAILPVGGINLGVCYSALNLNQVPAYIKQIYPASWTTP